MVIISGKSGQLGNSLILYSGFIAFGLDNNISIFNPSFFRYKDYFEFTASKNNLNWFIFHLLYYYTRVLIKLKSKKAKELNWDENFNLDGEVSKSILSKSNYFIQGWQYRGNKALAKNKGYIIECFKPLDKYKESLDAFFLKNFYNKSETIVGIHIRRGDYQNFENGKYFYSMEQYKNIILNINKLFGDQQTHFLICSNEKIDTTILASLNINYTQAAGHELLDMYSLARCNYIAGPPSTYTMWASFYGNVPLLMLHDINMQIQKSDFKIQHEF